MSSFSSAVLKAVKEHDELVLKDFYRKNFRKVEAFIVKNGGSSHDAQDIYQEAFYSVWKNIREDRVTDLGNNSINGYLYQISKNKWFDHLRSKKSRYLDEDLIGNMHETVEEQDDLIEKRMILIRESFETLGRNCEKLLKDFYFGRKSMRWIAKEYGWTEPTAKNNKYRCLQKLRSIIKEKMK